MFTHLHLHTEYSLLDGLSRIRPLVQRARDLGMEALAITDHGGMYGVVEFYSACREVGIKPILGCELYVAPGSRLDKTPGDKNPYHLTVLARNNTGYRNLIQLVTSAHLEGFYYRPRVDRELLENHREGLVVLSGCPSAQVPRLLLDGRQEEAREAARWYQRTFDDFYLEVQRHGNLPELDQLNPALLELGQELGIPLVATNDLHYIHQQDAPFQDILVCIHTNTNVQDEKRLKMSDDSYYLKSPQEMAELFSDLPGAVENTQRIAEKCNVELDFSSLHLPQYDPPAGETAEAYLARLCREGLVRRLGDQPPEEVSQRLEYELEVIRQTRFANYFLVVWDIAAFTRRRGILFGVRGSAAASLALYCLDVTDINPLEYRLVFERFLNLERKEMPDIDMDFQDDRRDEVIQYVTRKYGRDHVAQIITFGTLGAKAAIRDVGRALAMPYADVDRVARLVPFRLHITLDEAIESTPELKEMYQEDATLRHLIDTARRLEGVVRHASTHAAGVVISQEPLAEYVPLQRPIKGDDQGIAMTQFPMEPIAKLGLLKMDLLGLANLTILGRARDTVAQTQGVTIDLHQIPLDDQATFELLGSGETTGVFQLEGGGMRRHIKELKPTSLNDLAAMIALYRPGPMEHIETFIRAKHGRAPVRYPHPTLKEVLEETYGVIVYQDQVLLILQAFAGYSLGEADIVRKAMGKKIAELMAPERERFIQGAIQKEYSRELAKEIFDLIEPFAGYAFNKAHSVSYALIAYWTAYFKANYPVEYMTAVLNSHRGNADKTAAAAGECARLGIPILPPDVNHSDVAFSIEHSQDGTEAIRFGLAAIKNVGVSAVRPIVQARQEGGPFSSVDELCRRADLRGLNRRTLESLIKVGALDSLAPRGPLLASADRIVALSQKEAQLKASGQATMFDLFGQSVPTSLGGLELRQGEEVSAREKLAWEKELLGLYLSDNPISALVLKGSANVILSRSQIDTSMKGQQVDIAGLVAGISKRTTREGKPFITVELQMIDGSIEVVVWPREYGRTEEMWQEGLPVVIVGKVREREDEVSIACDEARPYEMPTEEAPKQESHEGPPVREWNDPEDPADAALPAPEPAEAAPPGPRLLDAHGEAEPPPSEAGKKEEQVNGGRKLLINLAETPRQAEDDMLLREVLQVLSDYPGSDSVDLVIASNGKKLRVEMPLFPTNYCAELHQHLAELLGREDAVRLEG